MEVVRVTTVLRNVTTSQSARILSKTAVTTPNLKPRNSTADVLALTQQEKDTFASSSFVRFCRLHC